MLAVMFLGRDYSPLEIILLIVSVAVTALVVSSISRLAFYAERNHLVLLEIQKDLHKVVMLGVMKTEEHSRTGQAGASAHQPDPNQG